MICWSNNLNPSKDIYLSFLNFPKEKKQSLLRETSYSFEEMVDKDITKDDNIKCCTHFLNRFLFLNFQYQFFSPIHDLHCLSGLEFEHFELSFIVHSLRYQIFNYFHHFLI